MGWFPICPRRRNFFRMVSRPDRSGAFRIPPGNRNGVLPCSQNIFSVEPKTAHPEIWRAQVPAKWEKWAKVAIILAAGFLLYAAALSGVLQRLFRVVPNVPLGSLWFWSMALYGAMHYAVMVWRICLWLSYRPMAPIDEDELPMVSVVIPAYNEGALVRKCHRLRYPPGVEPGGADQDRARTRPRGPRPRGRRVLRGRHVHLYDARPRRPPPPAPMSRPSP